MASFSGGGTYDGEFHQGKPHGEGKRRWADGRVYRGLWESGLQHGPGEMTFTNGDRFSGTFEQGKMNGVGTCITLGVESPCTYFDGERLN